MFAAGVALRVLFLLLSANNGGDALDRVGKTEEWLEYPSLQLFFGPWMPLHFWMMGGLGALLGNVEWAGRLLSLVMGVGSMWLVWRMARREYGEYAALLSLCAIAFYTLHIGYSTTTSSEMPYLFLSLVGLDLLLHDRRDSRVERLVWSGLFFGTSAAIRYEAWVLIAGAVIILAALPWKSGRSNARLAAPLPHLVIFVVTAGAWPVFWMALTFSQFGDPLYFLTMQHVWVPIINRDAGITPALKLVSSSVLLVLSLSLPVVLAAVYGIWRAIREPEGRALAVLYIFFAAVQLYQIITEGMWPAPRFTITQGALLAILAGHGLYRWADWLVPRWRPARVAAVLSAVLLLNLAAVTAFSEMRQPYSDTISNISPRLRFPHYVHDVGDFLRARYAVGEPLVIDDYSFQSVFVAVAAGLPVRPGDEVFLKQFRRLDELRPFLEQRRPRYVVYSAQGKLREVLHLPEDCSVSQAWEIEFRCVYSNEIYSVFELDHGQASPE
ncbi:MAG: ArnT family glycosyltransferase [Candidatus Acidiferrales bacterium]